MEFKLNEDQLDMQKMFREFAEKEVKPIAEEILIVAAPGANPVDNRDLPYKHLRKGLRLMPLGEAFAG